MDLLGSIIGVGGSLLGGLLGKKSARSAEDRQNEYNKPINIRARAEEAGFNPLLFVGPGVGNQMSPGASGHMGAAITDAAMIAANEVSGRAEEKARLEQLELQNKKLRQEVNHMTLRPRTPGIYGTGGAPTSSGLKSSSATGDPIRDWALTGEKPEREEMKDEAFLKNVRVGGEDFIVPAEPDLDEFLTNLAFMAPQKGRHAVRSFEDRLHRSLRGKSTKAEKAKAKADAVSGAYNMSLFGLMDRTRDFMGFQRPLHGALPSGKAKK